MATTTTITKKIKNNLDIYVSMSNYDISPKIIKIDGNKITMEKYDNTLEFLYNFYYEFPKNLELKIVKLIDSMHSMDIAHGDLHPRNIVYKIVDGETIFKFIDFDYSFRISTGENDKKVTKRRLNDFKFEKEEFNTYAFYVNYDYESWKDNFSLRKVISFKEIDDLIGEDDDIFSAVIAQLSVEFNFKVFGVFAVEKDETSIDQSIDDFWKDADILALQLPNNKYYIGYSLMKPDKEMHTMQEIRKYYLSPKNMFVEKNDLNVNCLFVDVTNGIQLYLRGDLGENLNDDLVKKISNFAKKYLGNDSNDDLVSKISNFAKKYLD